MKAEPWIRLAAEAPLENFETFLTSEGFTQTDVLGNKAVLFQFKNGESVLLPLSKEFSDFELRMADLVSSIADILKMSRDVVSKTVSSVGFDIFRIRTGIGRESFSVDLDDALDLLHNGYALVDYSAVFATSRVPVPFIQGRRTKEVATYLDTVRMGQTEPGSFVLTLLLPNIRNSDLVEESPLNVALGQRVSDALALGLSSSKEALSTSSRVAAARHPFTANFATALAEIVARSSEIEIGVEQRHTKQDHRVLFSRADEEPLRELADNMAPKVKSWAAELTGTVTNVTEPRGQKNGTFIIETHVDDGTKNVKVPFARSERKMIIQAFDEKADVKLRVCGRVVKSAGGRFSVEAPSGISIIRRGELT